MFLSWASTVSSMNPILQAQIMVQIGQIISDAELEDYYEKLKLARDKEDLNASKYITDAENEAELNYNKSLNTFQNDIMAIESETKDNKDKE